MQRTDRSTDTNGGHMTSHAAPYREQPYQCKTCEARFTHLRSLKLNRLRSHMEAEQEQHQQDTGKSSSATQQESPDPQAAATAAAGDDKDSSQKINQRGDQKIQATDERFVVLLWGYGVPLHSLSQSLKVFA
ncbi:hypothetical protein Bbelb_317870 [Branchiostoma belcheri]|nr:hypothetical protein Bbelb_317870 [Branchiostoma belcheri]